MTDARVTQTSVEEWAAGNPQARATQVSTEVWGAISATTVTAVVTQLAVEQWGRVPAVIVPGGNCAVTINSG